MRRAFVIECNCLCNCSPWKTSGSQTQRRLSSSKAQCSRPANTDHPSVPFPRFPNARCLLVFSPSSSASHPSLSSSSAFFLVFSPQRLRASFQEALRARDRLEAERRRELRVELQARFRARCEGLRAQMEDEKVQAVGEACRNLQNKLQKAEEETRERIIQNIRQRNQVCVYRFGQWIPFTRLLCCKTVENSYKI